MPLGLWIQEQKDASDGGGHFKAAAPFLGITRQLHKAATCSWENTVSSSFFKILKVSATFQSTFCVQTLSAAEFYCTGSPWLMTTQSYNGGRMSGSCDQNGSYDQLSKLWLSSSPLVIISRSGHLGNQHALTRLAVSSGHKFTICNLPCRLPH